MEHVMSFEKDSIVNDVLVYDREGKSHRASDEMSIRINSQRNVTRHTDLVAEEASALARALLAPAPLVTHTIKIRMDDENYKRVASTMGDLPDARRAA